MNIEDLPELPERYFWYRERDGDIAILYNHNHPTPPPPAKSVIFDRGKGTEVVARATKYGYAIYYGLEKNLVWSEGLGSQEEAITALYGRFLLGEWE